MIPDQKIRNIIKQYKNHRDSNPDTWIEWCRSQSSLINAIKTAEPERKKFTNSGRIVLISQKGNRLDGEHNCNECNMVRKPVYRYSESNIGPVIICNECKIKVFNRSFDPAGPKGEDLIGKRIKSGGGWETNRSKH